jgi:hypothetical protein
MRKFTAEEDAILRNLFETTTTLELSKILNRNAPVIRARMKLLGLVRIDPHAYSPEMDGKIIAAHKNGMTATQMAALIGRSNTNVRKRLVALGLWDASNNRTAAARDNALRQGIMVAKSKPKPRLPDPVGIKNRKDTFDAVLNLEHDQCRWPKGHPGLGGFRFCRRKACKGKTYCQKHHDRAYPKMVVMGAEEVKK